MNNSIHVVLPAVPSWSRRPSSCCSSTSSRRSPHQGAGLGGGRGARGGGRGRGRAVESTAGLVRERLVRREAGFNGMVRLDQYGLFFTVLFCGIGVLTIMLSDGYLAQHDIKPGEFYALLLLVVAGMIGMAISTDLIALLVSFELMSLPTYVLAGDPAQRPALGRGRDQVLHQRRLRLGGAGLRPGARLRRHGGRPGTRASALHLALTDPRNAMLLVALVLVATGFGFKIAAVPFHGWAPDVYEGAPTPVTAFMSVGIKAGAFAGFLRLVGFALHPGGPGLVRRADRARRAHHGRRQRAGPAAAQPQAACWPTRASPTPATCCSASSPSGRSGDPAGASAILFYLAVYTFMNLGAFGVPRAHPQPAAVRLHPRRARRPRPFDAAHGARHDGVHALAHRHPAARRVLGQVLHLLRGGRRPHDLARRRRRDHERGVGLLLPARRLVPVLPRGREPRPRAEQPELLARRRRRLGQRRPSPCSACWPSASIRRRSSPRPRGPCGVLIGA